MMVDWLVDVGVGSRMGLIREDNLLGDEYAAAMRARARVRGLDIAADVVLGSFCTDAEAQRAIAELRAAKADCYAYVGFGMTVPYVLPASRAAAGAGYDVPRITMSIFMGSIPGIGYGMTPEMFEGWTGVDQYDETNPVFMAMLDRFATRYEGRRPVHCYTAQGYDMGNAVAHGLALAKPHSRDGLRLGLERVRRVPATAGGPGNVISFGPWDHRGYKGEYIVMRRMSNGVNELAL